MERATFDAHPTFRINAHPRDLLLNLENAKISILEKTARKKRITGGRLICSQYRDWLHNASAGARIPFLAIFSHVGNRKYFSTSWLVVIGVF
jgi:hypothetical protein